MFLYARREGGLVIIPPMYLTPYAKAAGINHPVPKAASALTSGEMSDTVFMTGVGNVVERFIPRKTRKDMWTTWGSLWSVRK